MSSALVNGVTGAVTLAAFILAHFGLVPSDIAYLIAGGGTSYLSGQAYTFAAKNTLKSWTPPTIHNTVAFDPNATVSLDSVVSDVPAQVEKPTAAGPAV